MNRKNSLLFSILAFSILSTGCLFSGKAKLEGLQKNTSWVLSSEEVYFLKRNFDNFSSLFSVELNGENERKLVDGPVSSFQFSRDGKKIAFLKKHKDFRDNECGILNLATLESQILSASCSEIDFHPNSNLVSYVVEKKRYIEQPKELRNKIIIYNFTTNLHKQIFISNNSITGPRWSNDGEKLFFNNLSYKYYSYDLLNDKIDILHESTNGNLKWKDFLSLSDFHFNQSSEGTFRYSSSLSYNLYTLDGSLYIRNTQSNETKLLVENIGAYNTDFGPTGLFQPVWTANEKYILARFEKDLIVVEIATGKSGILTRGSKAQVFLPKFSPTEIKGSPMYYRCLN